MTSDCYRVLITGRVRHIDGSLVFVVDDPRPAANGATIVLGRVESLKAAVPEDFSGDRAWIIPGFPDRDPPQS